MHRKKTVIGLVSVCFGAATTFLVGAVEIPLKFEIKGNNIQFAFGDINNASNNNNLKNNEGQRP